MVDGPSFLRGRLEIYYLGTWGTVCDDYFTNEAADVVCRQIGVNMGGHFFSSNPYPEGRGEIWLDNVRCSGDEARLSQCDHAGWGIADCGHSEDVAVACNAG